MKIKMKEERQFADLGLKKEGEVFDVDEKLGSQLISQGFARPVIKKKKEETEILKKKETKSKGGKKKWQKDN